MNSRGSWWEGKDDAWSIMDSVSTTKNGIAYTVTSFSRPFLALNPEAILVDDSKHVDGEEEGLKAMISSPDPGTSPSR